MAETNENNRKFGVVGPMTIHAAKLKKRKSVDKGAIENFWEKNKKWEERRGCYVFAIKAAKGYRPIYVGKASGKKGFKQQVFNPKNRGHINHALADTGSGTPVLFFVVLDDKAGPQPDSVICQVEIFLIARAAKKNPKLANLQGTKKPAWYIEGVVRAKPGKPRPAAQKFKSLMGMK